MHFYMLYIWILIIQVCLHSASHSEMFNTKLIPPVLSLFSIFISICSFLICLMLLLLLLYCFCLCACSLPAWPVHCCYSSLLFIVHPLWFHLAYSTEEIMILPLFQRSLSFDSHATHHEKRKRENNRDRKKAKQRGRG